CSDTDRAAARRAHFRIFWRSIGPPKDHAGFGWRLCGRDVADRVAARLRSLGGLCYRGVDRAAAPGWYFHWRRIHRCQSPGYGILAQAQAGTLRCPDPYRLPGGIALHVAASRPHADGSAGWRCEFALRHVGLARSFPDRSTPLRRALLLLLLAR